MANTINASLQSGDELNASFRSGNKMTATFGDVTKLGSIDVYPVGSTELAADWLSLTNGGEALAPSLTDFYALAEASTNYALGTRFRWNGTRYVAVLDGDVDIDDTLTRAGVPADAKAVGDAIDDVRDDLTDATNELSGDITQLKSDLEKESLLCENVPNTVQTYTFTDGNVTQILHSSNGAAVRTDTFAYTETTITETRTLASGAQMVIVTNLSTLETSVTYTAA